MIPSHSQTPLQFFKKLYYIFIFFMFILSMLLPNLLENKNLLKADASLERMAAYLSQSRASSDNDSFK